MIRRPAIKPQLSWFLPKIGFVLVWTLLTLLGWVVAALVGNSFGMSNAIGAASAGLLGGIAVGIFNWLALRNKIHGSGWWILATAAGFGFALALMGLVGALVSLLIANQLAVYTVTFAIVGILAAVPQWFFLIQRSQRALGWLAASGLGWMGGWLALLAFNLVESSPLAYFSTIGVIYGLVTGLGLLFLGADHWKKQVTARSRS